MRLNKGVVLVLAFAIFFSSVAFEAEHKYVFPANEQARILFVGDLMFDRGIRYYAEKGKGNSFIFAEISELLRSVDLVVANLEGPITDEKSISYGTKAGSANNYFFTFDPSVAQTLFDENIKLVNLGNNHILNFGSRGLASTEKYLSEAGVGYFGPPAGPPAGEANIRGIKIAFVSYNEFYPRPVIDEIKKARETADVVIVYSHWGIEYAKEPNQAIRDLAHSFIDAGADLVIGSHPHVVQPAENYNGKRIYYSLGNFVFDQHFSQEVRQGLGVIAEIEEGSEQIKFEEVNFYLSDTGQTVPVDKTAEK